MAVRAIRFRDTLELALSAAQAAGLALEAPDAGHRAVHAALVAVLLAQVVREKQPADWTAWPGVPLRWHVKLNPA